MKQILRKLNISSTISKDGGNIIINKEYAAFIGSAEEFRGCVLSAAVNTGYGRVREVVIIADGATWIRNMAKELFPEATQILDLYHLKENIYTYAKHKFSQNEKEYMPWAEAVIAKIEKGRAEEVLKQLPENEKLPSGVINLRTYITNNIDKINYPEYKSKGYFAGSGAIESTNRLLFKGGSNKPVCVGASSMPKLCLLCVQKLKQPLGQGCQVVVCVKVRLYTIFCCTHPAGLGTRVA